ncbi:carbohydrate kinase family protein [Falsirhodobacter halotolerans]|uniref:carbohydrate kinase family protein n=1 Tax=Falsirhodobacter halotolerans TaxID=1146892 RepID=UPI001FD3ADCC|nr:carbohydrate kinase [Falsirhodobacter halotolerans]MCJ8139061.1 carbohydrate kinase [Falsirhodobacter halotolerans]
MILCCGEALIDMLPKDGAFVPHAGGAVFNTAIALGRLGAQAGFLSGLSTDLFGAKLTEALAASHVDTGLAPRSDRPTTLAFVTLTDGQASYAFYDENTAGRLLSEGDLPALPETIGTLFFGGISLVSEPAADTYAALLARESASRVVMLDPNIRPGFIRDAARYRDRIGRMMAGADIVKLSDEDLHWLEGPGDTVALAQALLDRGPKVVLLTEGAEGARAITRRTTRRVPARKVTVADTVGAGDTFNAGFLAALDRAGALTKTAVADLSDDLLDAALTLGIRAAAITVSRAGANPPWAREV